MTCECVRDGQTLACLEHSGDGPVTPPVEQVAQPTDGERTALRAAIFDDLLESAKAFPDLHAALSGLRPGTAAALVDCITDTVLELRA